MPRLPCARRMTDSLAGATQRTTRGTPSALAGHGKVNLHKVAYLNFQYDWIMSLL